MPNGIPSHDSFDKVFAAIDGKCLSRSIDKASGKAVINMVSAWAQKNSLVLGQVKVAEKSNEITAIPVLLSRLDIAGAVVTMDAMGCQKKKAEQIIEKGADYMLSLKGNQDCLHDDVTTYFESPLSPDVANISFDGGHGRIETRPIRVTDKIDWLKENHLWVGLRSIIAVTATRETINFDRLKSRYLSLTELLKLTSATLV